jgi:hypothetical protein
MIAHKEAETPNSLNKVRARRLRLVGVFIFTLGLISAGVVYWSGKRAQDLSNELSMVGYDRAARRQIGVLYGRFGEIVEDLSDELKQPGTQAILIGCISAGITFGCFYFGRLLDNDTEIQ